MLATPRETIKPRAPSLPVASSSPSCLWCCDSVSLSKVHHKLGHTSSSCGLVASATTPVKIKVLPSSHEANEL
jgi:hypothetical protein